MAAFVIDPDAQTVEEVTPDPAMPFLDWVRRELGVPQLAVIPAAENRFAIWVDALALIKPGRTFWAINDADYRYAGKSLVTGLSPEGWPMSFPAEATAATVRAGITFLPSDELLRIDEEIVIGRDEQNRPVPMIARKVVWKGLTEPPAEPAEADAGGGWTIYEREAGGFRAVLYELRDDKLEAMQMVSAAKIEELRRLLPPGLARVEPSETDAPEVVEHWVRPAAAEVAVA